MKLHRQKDYRMNNRIVTNSGIIQAPAHHMQYIQHKPTEWFHQQSRRNSSTNRQQKQKHQSRWSIKTRHVKTRNACLPPFSSFFQLFVGMLDKSQVALNDCWNSPMISRFPLAVDLFPSGLLLATSPPAPDHIPSRYQRQSSRRPGINVDVFIHFPLRLVCGLHTLEVQILMGRIIVSWFDHR